MLGIEDLTLTHTLQNRLKSLTDETVRQHGNYPGCKRKLNKKPKPNSLAEIWTGKLFNMSLVSPQNSTFAHQKQGLTIYSQACKLTFLIPQLDYL